MVFVWRGSGITVPIFLFLSGFIMSNWYDDTRLGNYPFLGWTLFWAGIVLTLQGVAVWGGGKPDPDTGEVHIKKGHDFFWIPVLFWGLACIGFGIYFVNQPEAGAFTSSTTPPTESSEPYSKYEERMVNIYNPFDDSMQIVISDLATKEEIISTTVPAHSTRYKSFACVPYYLAVDGVERSERMRVTVARDRTANEYAEAWHILGGAMDVVLIDVTDVCDSAVVRDDIIAINWISKVKERYNGKQLVEPFVKYQASKKPVIFGINDDLPMSHRKRERVYAVVPVDDRNKLDEAYLDAWIISKCFE
ncbi:MAG: hypothetical protein A3D92_12895 [Bacteroidetes bacterium RIFCSPHIGHO2_02_FULL_44_7]|nr:MAG: hypothetical protein A3D92_12895 [Bacteroidetes bacterium RIFCSPHIGHO2_02_FULL_44_7]